MKYYHWFIMVGFIVMACILAYNMFIFKQTFSWDSRPAEPSLINTLSLFAAACLALLGLALAFLNRRKQK